MTIRPRVRRLALVAAFTLLAVITILATAPLVAHRFRPGLRAGEVYGIDVSNHQRTIDWPRVAAAGIEATYIKASEGRGYVDPFFATNWRASGEAGIRHGAYHFFTLCATGADQAANFLAVAPPDPQALPPAVDLEILDGCSERPSAATVQREVGIFVDLVERAWRRPMVIYARSSWTDTYPLAQTDRPRWRTRFFLRPQAPWAVWQVQYWARVDGIDGNVDLDVYQLTAMP